MSANITIVGCGMMTPIGLSTPEAAASARARVPRLTMIAGHDRQVAPFVVGRVPEEALPPLVLELDEEPMTHRETRMLKLADPALSEALVNLPKAAASLPIFIGLPEIQTHSPIKGERFLRRLVKQTGVRLDLGQSKVFAAGRSAALLAMQSACEYLEKNPSSFAVVGGVDSQIDPYILGTFDLQQRIRTASNSDGFAPGEGACFMLLASAELAQTSRLVPLAEIAGVGSGKEDGHFYSELPYRGEGLAAAFEQLFEAKTDLPKIGCVYVSFNGEHYWAKEYGVAMIRHRSRFTDDQQTEHPAECFGDLGAAHGAVLLGLATAARKRAVAGTATLVSASSDLGDRAVVALVNAS